MSLIDNDMDYIDEKSVSIWSTALTYGVFGGIAIVIYKYLSYATLFSTASLGGAIAAFFLNLIIFGGLIYLAIKKHRDEELGGYITMGRCLALGIVTVVIASILGGVFDYIYTAFIDTEVTSKMVANMGWMYEMMGLDEDQIEETIEVTQEAQMSPNLLMAVGGSALGGALTGLIMSAIVGALTRKDRPEIN